MFFTLRHRPDLKLVPSSPGAISEFFPNTKLLILTYHDLDGVSRVSWFNLYDTVTKFVRQHKTELIILDRTGEPKVLDQEEVYGPNDITIAQSLQAVCPTMIMTDDYTYYTKQHSHVICFPYNIWLLASRGVATYENFHGNGYDSELIKTRPMMCLNRKLHWHRIFLYLQLRSRSWFKHIDYSFILGNDRMDTWFLLKDLTQEEIDQMNNSGSQLPIMLSDEQVSVSSNIEVNGSTQHWTSVNLPVYSRNAMNLVTETSLNHGTLLTEKAVKPIMAYQIPVILAAPGANTWLQSLGLDLFADFVPWADWDNLQDQKQKILMILDWLDTVMEDPELILEFHSQCHQRLLANKQWFHSAEFIRKLEQPIRTYAHSISSTSSSSSSSM